MFKVQHCYLFLLLLLCCHHYYFALWYRYHWRSKSFCIRLCMKKMRGPAPVLITSAHASAAQASYLWSSLWMYSVGHQGWKVCISWSSVILFIQFFRGYGYGYICTDAWLHLYLCNLTLLIKLINVDHSTGGSLMTWTFWLMYSCTTLRSCLCKV